jgi:hypothetical protein
MINASAAYHFYETEQLELLRQLEMRRVQLERGADSTLAPSRLRRAIDRLTATRTSGRTAARTAAGRVVRTDRQSAAAPAPCPDPA